MPSRVALARSIARVAQTQTPVTGFADHAVSEAMYLPDPDGNGIEIYRDRPRDAWEYPNGTLKLVTDRLDINGILSELDETNSEWNGLESGTLLGHMHLHVSDIAMAEGFYGQVIGFDMMARYGPSASFLAAGGYHHHLGINTWAGVGAPPQPEHAVGLRYYTIVLPDESARDQVADRARQADVDLVERADGLYLRDPAGNGVVLVV